MADEARQRAITRLDDLVRVLEAAPNQPALAPFVADSRALRQSVVTFHMEGIRFRAFTLERRLAAASDLPAAARDIFADVKRALEEAGFAIKSH